MLLVLQIRVKCLPCFFTFGKGAFVADGHFKFPFGGFRREKDFPFLELNAVFEVIVFELPMRVVSDDQELVELVGR